MPSTAIDSQIHGCMFSTDEMRRIWSDQSWAQKWLDTEAALAKAQGELGVIPQEKAELINKYAKAELLDIPSIGEFYKSSITIVPLLKAFKKVLPDNAGEFVHWGATSQDIVDTGMVLLQRDAYQVILRDMKACLGYCLDLAKKYNHTVMAGRTHVVHAIPITFGYKAAVWADELGRDIERIEAMAPRVFVGEMSGAVGTLASQPEKGLETQKTHDGNSRTWRTDDCMACCQRQSGRVCDRARALCWYSGPHQSRNSDAAAHGNPRTRRALFYGQGRFIHDAAQAQSGSVGKRSGALPKCAQHRPVDC